MSLRAGAAVPRERASESWRRRGRGAGGPGGTARAKGPVTKVGDGAEEEQGEKRVRRVGGRQGPPTRGPVRRSALGQAASRRVQSGEKQARGRGGRRQRQARRLVSRVDSTRPRGPDTRSNAALGASGVSLGEISVRWVHSVNEAHCPPHCGWPSSTQSKASIEQKGRLPVRKGSPPPGGLGAGALAFPASDFPRNCPLGCPGSRLPCARSEAHASAIPGGRGRQRRPGKRPR